MSRDVSHFTHQTCIFFNCKYTIPFSQKLSSIHFRIFFSNYSPCHPVTPSNRLQPFFDQTWLDSDHPECGYSQNTTEGRKPLCCVHFTESPLAAGDNLVLTHLPDDARGNQPGIVNGIPLVDGGAADIIEFRAFPGQGRGRALAV